ncbi:phasin family protein [Aurantiacibacter sp. MUD11]|uniref:phasin family protein n=1 Tax=Aurantiacibacter sp. MUD11 TaxID=3003265 RepID=UPI0022AA3A98|nr:phasin family protein [Aurantiacibacter sp. MUD11]WAT19241.1 phasin family protein [Aurantiacibacter sp. MUD11]
MATSKTDEKAEKAYAAAAEAKPAPAAKKAPVKKAASKPAAAKKAPAKKPAAKKTLAKKPAAKKPTKKAPVRKPVKAAKTGTPQTTVTQLKEKIMATKTVDYTTAFADTMSSAVNEMQTRAQAAYEKSTEAMTEATEFAKGNVEAVVESGKVWAEGVQGMGQSFADEAKSAYETATADLKEMAGVKSPTELFQLQGKILRRNFDAMVAASSKTTDASMKLANDVMAPISGRVNVAAEKLSKVG